MSLDSKLRELRKIRREIPVDTMLAWGLPYGIGATVETPAFVLDIIDITNDGETSYHEVIFRAPDDLKVYRADYRVSRDPADPDYWDDPTVTCTHVEAKPRVITVTDWVDVVQQPDPKIPTKAELRARWAQNREDDLAAAEDATWH